MPALNELMELRPLSPPDNDELEITGSDPVLETRFRLAETAAAALAGEQYVAVIAPAEERRTTSPSHPLRWHAQSGSSSEHATFEQATPISPHFQSSDNVAAETLAGSTRHLSHAAHWAQSAGGGGTAGAGATGAGTAVRRQSCTSEASLPSTAAASPSRLTGW